MEFSDGKNYRYITIYKVLWVQGCEDLDNS